MKYYRIDTLGNTQDKRLAIINRTPEGLGLYDAYVATGRRVTEHYPDNAKITLQAKYPGIRLSSFLGNTRDYLIVHADVKTVIEKHCPADLEVLPFTLYNHKGKEYSKDYWIINPIGSVDCVDRQASDIVYLDDTKTDIVSIQKYVFDADRLAHSPALFRVPEECSEYFMNENLVNELIERKFTNFVVREVPLVSASQRDEATV